MRKLERTGRPERFVTIGILGGGQLALMLARAASQLGIRVRVLEPAAECPVQGSIAECIRGSWEEFETLEAFAAEADVVTLENEFVSAALLERLERLGRKVFPCAQTMRLVQDKFIQKQTLRAAGLSVPEFWPVASEAEGIEALEAAGIPCVLKRRTLGYDGTGNVTIRSVAEFLPAVERLGGFAAGLYLEKWCSFSRELAVMVTRGADGQSALYPVVETWQQDHICGEVLAPAPISPGQARSVCEMGLRAVEAVSGVGTFGIELFETADGALLINEMAPRVHNSGHYTLEACACSQFENHIRAILGWPLGNAALMSPAAMVNLLSPVSGSGLPRGVDKALAVSGARLHFYGKRDAAPGRKMGHVTALGPNAQSALEKARAAAQCIRFKAYE